MQGQASPAKIPSPPPPASDTFAERIASAIMRGEAAQALRRGKIRSGELTRMEG